LTLLFNKRSEKEKRRKLRNNSTRAEVYLWTKLRSKKLGFRFLRQYGVGKYVIDFYSPRLKLAIEVDGITHLTKEELEYDERRQSEIEQVGIQFIRFTNWEVYNDIENVIKQISDRIESIQSQ
jgi:very-short-patch-repair endonuclease